MTQKMLLIDHRTGVLVGPGRFENWLFRRHADGYWVSVRKLPEGDPLENSPIRMDLVTPAGRLDREGGR